MKKLILTTICTTSIFSFMLPAGAQEDQTTRYLEKIQQNVGMRSGTFWPLFEMQNKVFYDGQLVENLYPTLEDLKAAIPIVGGLTPMSPAMVDYLLTQDGMSRTDFPYSYWDLALGEVTIETPEDYIAMGIRDGWMIAGPDAPEALPSYVPPSLDSILNDPQKMASVVGYLPNLTTQEINDLFGNTNFTTESANSMLSAILAEKASQPTITKALAPFFAMAIDPQGVLYANRTSYDFTAADLTGIPLEGANLSALQINASQLNSPSGNNLSTNSYNGTNFSGMNLSGFAPVPKGLVALGGTGPDNNGGYFVNANFSNATNLSPTVLAKATMLPTESGGFNGLQGVILTGSNVTREALRTAIITNLQNDAKVQYNTGFWTQQKIDSFVDGILNEVTF